MPPVFAQTYVLPVDQPTSPIVVIGAGGIVQTAHLPAYQLANYPVAGIYDIDHEKARAVAARFNIPVVYSSLTNAVTSAPTNVVFDIAVPGAILLEVLSKLPTGATVLMQKPMGENLAQAEAIVALCQRNRLVAGVNFQLRYAPFMLTARAYIEAGLLGTICDVEVNVNVFTPWHLWDFLAKAPRLEILYHSIHYLDWVRNLLGEPIDLFARTIRHPRQSHLASVKSSLYLDYGQECRATILTNHMHNFGREHEQSYIKIEGTQGAIFIEFGLLKNYPTGVPDSFEYTLHQSGERGNWQPVTIEGTWFPHAFIGSMGEMLKTKAGEIDQPDNDVNDCLLTMKWVERAYQNQ